MTTNANRRQIGGTHYKTGSGFEHWDLISQFGIGYLEGCATKYVARARLKNGRQDLDKAVHFVEKLIELARLGDIPVPPMGHASDASLWNFASAQQLTGLESSIITSLCQWRTVSDLENVLKLLNTLVSDMTLQEREAEKKDPFRESARVWPDYSPRPGTPEDGGHYARQQEEDDGA